jgi:hypothetical protein
MIQSTTRNVAGPLRSLTLPPLRSLTLPPLRSLTLPPLRSLTLPPLRSLTLPPLRSLTLPARLCLVLLFASIAFAKPLQLFTRPQRDWEAHPAILEIAGVPEDLYALGDVHGDYERLVRLLVAAKIMPGTPTAPTDGRWSAGKATLVCTGDFIDKGDQSLDVIALFQKLQKEAAKAGGRFLVTMGNHEAAFLADPSNSKAVKFRAELDVKKIDVAPILTGKTELGRFLYSLPLGVRIGDWFFAHAGYIRDRTIKQLAAELREGIDAHGYDIDLVPALRDLVEARLHPMPWWEKKGDAGPESWKRLSSLANNLGVRHLVVGHQPNNIHFSDGSKRLKGTMVQKADGLIFLIDVGMSRGVPEGPYSEGALLHIRRNLEASQIYPNGTQQKLWP